MNISDWLDEKEAEGVDVAQIVLPGDLHDEDPEETIFFEEIHPCETLCTGNHPFSTVERFGDWRTIQNLNDICEAHLNGQYSIEVIDI